MEENVKKAEDADIKTSRTSGTEYTVVLHNDEVNSFDYVARILIEVCDHDIIQAEQCTYLTHLKGRCDVKVGEMDYLRPIRHSLIEKGLRATIEKSV